MMNWKMSGVLVGVMAFTYNKSYVSEVVKSRRELPQAGSCTKSSSAQVSRQIKGTDSRFYTFSVGDLSQCKLSESLSPAAKKFLEIHNENRDQGYEGKGVDHDEVSKFVAFFEMKNLESLFVPEGRNTPVLGEVLNYIPSEFIYEGPVDSEESKVVVFLTPEEKKLFEGLDPYHKIKILGSHSYIQEEFAEYYAIKRCVKSSYLRSEQMFTKEFVDGVKAVLDKFKKDIPDIERVTSYLRIFEELSYPDIYNELSKLDSKDTIEEGVKKMKNGNPGVHKFFRAVFTLGKLDYKRRCYNVLGSRNQHFFEYYCYGGLSETFDRFLESVKENQA